MSQNRFEQLVDLLRHVDFAASRREGQLCIIDAGVLADLRAVVDDEELGLILPDEDIDDVALGASVTVELLEPRLGIGVFATDVQDFLRAPSYRISPPRLFYILSLGYSSLQETKPPVIARYRDLVDLIGLFRNTATYVDEPNATLVYLEKERFDIQIRYTETDLDTLDLASVALFTETLSARDGHRDQKLAILGQAMQDLTKGIGERDRFQHILRNLSSLHDSFMEGYRLFAASFSYSKIKGELEAARVEYVNKIHKAISDIQNQLLGLPIATVIVATQMKEAEKVGAQFWTNLAVLAGAWIFVALLALLLRNQSHTLDSLRHDIEKQRADLESKYASLAPQLRGVFVFLRRRLRAQRFALWTIAVVALIAVVMATFFFFELTHPANEWLHRLVSTKQ
ncbi:putative phage-related membrane protein [Paraburkholderia caribensis MBA4]|uniref:Putative phage-related membrane protein n=1 Tax=Paraburkholderia caribensis MBA4 TaxID=1323664 RepID=A0A0P0RGV3_9BURK|nr:hypothetical protein [Paraburkholderia caribensis]ALL67855.1 putative phage-related membrane protein [Paraburkholderia caribensis MBA4]